MERIPILKMGQSLLVSIQVDMHDRLALTLQDDLTQQIVNTRARGVLIDISSLEVVDSFIGRMLANIAAMARVLDAQTVVVGMRPAVAITLVELGLVADRRAHGAQRRAGHASDRRATAEWEMVLVQKHEIGCPSPPTTTSSVCASVCATRLSVSGFSLVDQTKLVTAASELARNTLVYGLGGTLRIETVLNDRRSGLRLTFEDQGPGIADTALALTDGYTTGNGLGLGSERRPAPLPGFRARHREPGEGTRVTIARWK